MKRGAAGKTRDAYLANVPEPARSALKHIRAVIQSVAPKDTPEVIAYGIPRFKFRGMLVDYAAFRDHSSLFPTGSGVIEKLAKELKAYSTDKGTISLLRGPAFRGQPAQENRESASRRKPGVGLGRLLNQLAFHWYTVGLVFAPVR